MITHSVSLNMPLGQLFDLQHRITQQFNVYLNLVHLAGELAQELNKHDPTSPLLSQWHELMHTANQEAAC